MTSTLPPAAWIFASADLLNLWACTTSAFLISPFPRILTGRVTRFTSPASTRDCGVIVPCVERSPKLFTFTMAYSFRNGFLNPYFGIRRMSGICPPSNPGCLPPPDLAKSPLCPFVAVLPCPDPGPLPIRLRFFLAPLAGASSCRFIAATLPVNSRPDEEDHAPEECPVALLTDESSASPTLSGRADGAPAYRWGFVGE